MSPQDASPLLDLEYYESPVHKDERGFFREVIRTNRTFAQFNTSFSFAGVFRGMHLQRKNPQGKLVTCVFGEILDVVIDLRPTSPTFRKTFSIELSMHKGNSLYIPPGCAHGFLTLSKYSVIHYSCTTEFDKSSDGGVNWRDPLIYAEVLSKIGEDLPVVISEKDRLLPTVDEYLNQIL